MSAYERHAADLLCVECLAGGRARRAWSVTSGRSLCVRHAAEALFPDDDMRISAVCADVYEQLRAQGVLDAY